MNTGFQRLILPVSIHRNETRYLTWETIADAATAAFDRITKFQPITIRLPLASFYRNVFTADNRQLCTGQWIAEKQPLSSRLTYKRRSIWLSIQIWYNVSGTFGVDDAALKRIELYLTGRHQFVKIVPSTTQPTNCDCGVPQGSIRGPITFTFSKIANNDGRWIARCRAATVRRRHPTTCYSVQALARNGNS